MTTRTVPVPVDLWRASPLAQQLILRLLQQHADTDDGSVCVSPKSMRRYGFWDYAQLNRARKELLQRGLLTMVQPYRHGTRARYRLAWLEGTT